MNIKKSDYIINVHFVKHQVFYTPIYLCQQKGFDLKFTINDYELSDKKLVKELFNESVSKENEIDIFVTGGPDVVDFLRNQPQKEKGKVFFWMPIVDRLPLPLVTSKNSGQRYNKESIRDIKNIETPFIVYSPPEDTTLHYFFSKFYDKKAFKKKYLHGLDEDEKNAINSFLEKYPSIFEGKLSPQKDFDKIIENIKKDPTSIGFSLANDEEIRKFKKYHPPMEVIAFTCIYTKKDIWENEKKRAFLQNFCKFVSLNINEIHEFNRIFHRNKESNEYNHDFLEPVFTILSDSIRTNIEKKIFTSNLKYLAQNRIFATNISNDLGLLGEEIQNTTDKKTFEPFYQLKLYYWISEGYVMNALKEIDDLHEKEISQVELLKSISASTHAFKTTINTLFSAPLNSLRADFPDDYRIELLTQAKEKLLINSELVNLLSKLSIVGYGQESKEKALIDSKLFSKNKETIDVKGIIEKRLEIWNLDAVKSLKEISFNCNHKIYLHNDFLKYKQLYPTEKLFDMIVLTVIENCHKHGETENYKIQLSLTTNKNEVIFSNKAKPESQNPNILTGNLRVIHYLLKLLDGIGRVSLNLDNGIFYTTISYFKSK